MIQIKTEGMREFTRALRQADRAMGNEMRTVHRRVSDLMADRAKAGARRGGRQASKAAGAIKPRATNRSASIDVVAKPAFALAVFWGQKRRSGWFGASRFESSDKRQFKPWVGNQWDPGETGGKPYFIGPAINASIDEALDIYEEGIDAATRRAFPH